MKRLLTMRELVERAYLLARFGKVCDAEWMREARRSLAPPDGSHCIAKVNRDPGVVESNPSYFPTDECANSPKIDGKWCRVHAPKNATP